MLYKTPEGERAVMALYDEALEHWPVPYTTQCLPTRYGDAFVIASGEAGQPALILLHGAGGNSTMWAGDVAQYSTRFRVYVVDLPGEAGKSSPERPAWEDASFAEWLEDVLKGLYVERAALVGISQGGWTALKFAVAHPARVDKLVLLAPGGIVPDRASFLPRAILFMLMGQWGIRQMVKALFADQPVPDGVEDRVVLITRQFKPRIGVLPIFTDDDLRRLTMPTLLLGGSKDIARDMRKIETRLRGLLPDLTVNIVPGAGHALLDTGDAVMAFLTR
jgi:pimeloyl-ACP methyl ester carboxylesterase